MKPVSKRILQAVAALIAAIIGVLIYVTATQGGTLWLADIATKQSRGVIAVKSVSGTLFNGLEVQSLSYHAQGTHILIDKLAVDLSLRSLLLGYLEINYLNIDNVQVSLPNKQTKSDFDLSVMQAPINMRVHQLTVGQLDVQANRLTDINLSGEWVASKISLSQFSVRQQGNSVDLSGYANFSQGLPHDLTAEIAYQHHEFVLSAKGERGKSSLTVNADQHTVDLQAVISGLPKAPVWDATLWLNRVDDLHLGMLGESLLHDLQITSKGTWQQFSLNAASRLQTLDDDNLHISAKLLGKQRDLQIEHASIEHLPSKSKAIVSGDATFDGAYWVDVSLTNLRWPLDVTEDVIWSVPEATAKVEGKALAFNASTNATIQLPKYQALAATLQVAGNLQNKIDIVGGLAGYGGRANLIGDVTMPSSQWHAKLSVQDLQANDLSQQIDNTTLNLVGGDIDGEITAAGNVIAKEFDVVFDSLNGVLASQPLSGKGSISKRGARYEVDDLAIAIGDNRLVADAVIDDQLIKAKGQFNLTSRLLSFVGVDGHIWGDVSLSGSKQKPAIDADISIDSLVDTKRQLAVKAAKIAVKGQWLDPDQPLFVQGAVEQFSFHNHLIESAKLAVSGSARQFEASIDVEGEHAIMANLSANTDFKTIAGTLNQFSYQHSAIEQAQAQLVNPTKFAVSQASAQFKKACFAILSGELCADVDSHKPGHVKALFTGNKLSLGSRPRAQANIAQLDIDGELSYQQGSWSGTAKGKTEGGAIGFVNNDYAGSRFRMYPSTVSATVENNKLKALYDLSFNYGLSAAGEFVMPSILGKKIEGSAQLYSDDLTWLERFWPDMQDTYGIAWADITWRGTTDKPNILGSAELIDLGFNLGRYGTAVSAVNGELEFLPEGKARFDAKAQIGGEFAEVEADLDYFKKSFYLSLFGDRLVAANTADLYLEIQPDIEVLGDEEGVLIRGSVGIPKANIVRMVADESVITSDDVVVHQSGKVMRGSLPIETDIELRFGDDVKLVAKDFMAKLSGSIAVEKVRGQPFFATGNIYTLEGFYRLYGQPIDIKRGRVFYHRGPVSNPSIDINVERRVDATTVGAEVSGTFAAPKLELYSSPALPESTVLSYLMTGRAVENAQAGQLALLQVGAMISSTFLSSGFGESLGLSSMTITDQAVSFGRQFGSDFFVGVENDFNRDITELMIRYTINERTSIEMIDGEDSTIDLLYQVDKD